MDELDFGDIGLYIVSLDEGVMGDLHRWPFNHGHPIPDKIIRGTDCKVSKFLKKISIYRLIKSLIS